MDNTRDTIQNIFSDLVSQIFYKNKNIPRYIKENLQKHKWEFFDINRIITMTSEE